MDLIDLLGCAGAVVVLAAYALTNAPAARISPKTLHTLNLGAGALALNGVLHQAWPSAVLNAVWFGVAVVSLARPREDRATSSRSTRAR